MPGVFTLEWSDGRTEEIYGHRGYYYVFPDDTLLAFYPEPAWCYICGALTLCERLLPVAEIQAELDELKNPESTRSQELRKSSLPDFPEIWQHRRQLELRHAHARTLPASCLACGERQVSRLPDNEWAPHPATGERVRLYASGMCSTDYAMKFYDTDGTLLPLTEAERMRLLTLIDDGKVC
jgi:hypothetical protein